MKLRKIKAAARVTEDGVFAVAGETQDWKGGLRDEGDRH